MPSIIWCHLSRDDRHRNTTKTHNKSFGKKKRKKNKSFVVHLNLLIKPYIQYVFT